MKERIRLIMEYLQLSQQDFASRLGISPASLSSIFTGRTNPTNNHVNAIHREFPEINVNWLMFGEGEMLAAPISPLGGDATVSSSSSMEDEEISLANAQANAKIGDGGVQPSLFDVLPESQTQVQLNNRTSLQDPAYETSARLRHASNLRMPVINIDKQTRKIKEIRVFFDDGTFEAFVPSSK